MLATRIKNPVTTINRRTLGIGVIREIRGTIGIHHASLTFRAVPWRKVSFKNEPSSK